MLGERADDINCYSCRGIVIQVDHWSYILIAEEKKFRIIGSFSKRVGKNKYFDQDDQEKRT